MPLGLRCRAWLAGLASVVITLLLLQGSARLILFEASERALGARQLWQRNKNFYTQQLLGNSSCSFIDSLVAHPYLAFVHHNQPPCGVNTDPIGTHSLRERVQGRNPNFFSILVLGGSVASQFSIGFAGKIWLEDILNQEYESPNGKPFRVISGAVGSWSVPNQLTMLNLHGPEFDAVVAIDGYNEATRAKQSLFITAPDYVNYQLLVSYRLSLAFRLGVFWAKGMQKLSRNSFIGNSYLILALQQRLLSFLGRRVEASSEVYFKEFELPHYWSAQRKDRENAEKYKTYLKILDSTSRALGIPYAHFTQPVRILGKTLTPDELIHEPLIDRDQYKKIILETSREARKAGIYSFSLERVFESVEQDVYADDVHPKMDSTTGRSVGYELMANSIAPKLAEFWKLRKKKTPSSVPKS